LQHASYSDDGAAPELETQSITLSTPGPQSIQQVELTVEQVQASVEEGQHKATLGTQQEAMQQRQLLVLLLWHAAAQQQKDAQLQAADKQTSLGEGIAVHECTVPTTWVPQQQHSETMTKPSAVQSASQDPCQQQGQRLHAAERQEVNAAEHDQELDVGTTRMVSYDHVLIDIPPLQEHAGDGVEREQPSQARMRDSLVKIISKTFRILMSPFLKGCRKMGRILHRLVHWQYDRF
jgi:hypothetical protein